MSAAAAPPLRSSVLALYRTLLRTARSWRAKEPGKSAEEAAYIWSETRRLFRRNSGLTDTEAVRRCVREAEARLEIGLHYGNPYPRPVHFPPKSLAQSGQRAWGSANLRRQASSRPLYIHTIDSKELCTQAV